MDAAAAQQLATSIQALAVAAAVLPPPLAPPAPDVAGCRSPDFPIRGGSP